MLKVVIRAVEVPVALSLKVAGVGVSVAGRVAGWALAEVQGRLAPERLDGQAMEPEDVQAVPPSEQVPKTREPAQRAGDRSETTAPSRQEPARPGVPAAEDVGARTRDEPATPAQEEPGNGTGRARSPHSPLNNPVTEPDLTEWPDPYDQREDPRDPGENMVFGEDAGHTHTGSTSTSEPHPAQDPEAEPWEGPKRDKVDQ